MLFCHAPSLNSSSQLDLGKNFFHKRLWSTVIEQPYPSEEIKSSAEIEDTSNLSSFYDFWWINIFCELS